VAALLSASHNDWSNPNHGKHGSIFDAGQNFFHMIVERARRASDYSRLAGLQRRYLDDVGLTPAEFDAAIDDVVAFERQGTTASLTHSV
jgi:hypothetical protein